MSFESTVLIAETARSDKFTVMVSKYCLPAFGDDVWFTVNYTDGDKSAEGLLASSVCNTEAEARGLAEKFLTDSAFNPFAV